MKYLLIPLFFLLTNCSASKFNNLPQSAGQVDFNKLSKVNETKTPFWTSQTISEYYLELPRTSDSVIKEAVVEALNHNGYKKLSFNRLDQTFFAERGMRANEWGTVTAVYYRINNENTQLYVKSQISQDATGGWRENRAKKVAVKIQEYFNFGSTSRESPKSK